MEILGHQVHEDQMEPMVNRVFQEHKEEQVNQEHKVQLEPPV
jgi:hypothetical protein